jgi:hypothetical protein
VAESTAVLLSGVDLLDLGPRRLRDLPTAVEVFQVRAPGLRTEFPPLRALDASPGNLRPAVTSFIGREAELAELQTTLKAHRLVTLTGVGGVGKTRLALHVAGQLADEFPDGVWVFELASVTDPAALPDAVAAVLGITQQPGKSVTESVAAALEGRVRLLVIDNCEHVLNSAADLVEAILAHSATVTVLATSRDGLGLADEQVWPVPSLDVGAGIDSAAVTLFVERARSLALRFSLAKADEASAVLEICERLDGIPCWKRSASSPRNNSSPAAKHPRFGRPTRATSPDAKPTSWPCGTAPASVRPTTGSLSSWPTCAPHFGGPPTTAILMSPPPSPPMRGCSALWSKPLSRSPGPKS